MDSEDAAGVSKADAFMSQSRTSSIRVFDHLAESADSQEDVTLKSKARKWWGTQRINHNRRVATYDPLDWASLFLPCIAWLRSYSVRRNLLIDTVAGVSIGFMVVPQGMSYALLANLPAVYGLYAAFVPVLVYSVFGSSPHLAVGPVAVTSLLLGHALQGIFPDSKDITSPNNPGDLALVQEDYNTAAIQVTFLVGVCYLVVGILRLGFLANFLSHSVISGFTTGAAFIIGVSQLKYFFGITIKSTHTALETVIELCKHIDETQWREFVMATTFLALLLVIKQVAKRYPRLSWMRPLGPISVCAIGIIAVVAGDLDGRGLIRTVQHVPQGLPDFTLSSWFPLFDTGKQATTALVLFLVGFMESISISKALARKHDYEISVTQEILSMGLANFFGSMFQAYPATGSFSRSAVSADIGARTALQGTVTGVVVMLVLLFITPVFERVPYNAMGAIVLSSVLGLFELSEAIFLFKANFPDFLVWMAAFLGTIFLGVEIGLGIAIGLALIIVIYQSAFPHTAVLGCLPDSKIYRNIKQYPMATQCAHVLIVRVDAPIYFANVEWIQERIRKYRARADADPDLRPIYHVVLDMSPVPYVDSTGMHALKDLLKTFKQQDVQLVLANPSLKVQAQLQRVNILSEIGHENVFVRTADAVDVCRQAAAERAGQNIDVLVMSRFMQRSCPDARMSSIDAVREDKLKAQAPSPENDEASPSNASAPVNAHESASVNALEVSKV